MAPAAAPGSVRARSRTPERLAHSGYYPAEAPGAMESDYAPGAPLPDEYYNDSIAPSEDWMGGSQYDMGEDRVGFSDGGFGDDCCGEYCDDCGPVWFAEADVLLLQRSTAHKQVLTQTPVIFTIAGAQLVVNVELQTTRSFNFGYEPGMRINLGRHLGTDLINRDHTLEFMYYGLQDWDDSHQVVSDRIDTFLPDAEGGLAPVMLGRLNSPFPLEVGGFNRADVHHIQNSSTFNNFELNYRIRRRLGRGRLVGWPDGSWTEECTPGCTPSMLLGLRYISLDDRFNWLSTGAIENLDTGVTTPMLGVYKTHTSNDLLGLQIGGDLVYRWCRASLGARGKAGLYGNANQQTTHLSTQDGYGIFLLPQSDYKLNEQRMSFVGEFGFVGTWQVSRNVALKATYDFIWVQGIALAPEQLAFDLDAKPRVNDSGNLLFQGLGLGCEVRW
jgi:hypothetical protein